MKKEAGRPDIDELNAALTVSKSETHSVAFFVRPTRFGDQSLVARNKEGEFEIGLIWNWKRTDVVKITVTPSSGVVTGVEIFEPVGTELGDPFVLWSSSPNLSGAPHLIVRVPLEKPQAASAQKS
jgi:hypothetical protein